MRTTPPPYSVRIRSSSFNVPNSVPVPFCLTGVGAEKGASDRRSILDQSSIPRSLFGDFLNFVHVPEVVYKSTGNGNIELIHWCDKYERKRKQGALRSDDLTMIWQLPTWARGDPLMSCGDYGERISLIVKVCRSFNSRKKAVGTELDREPITFLTMYMPNCD